MMLIGAEEGPVDAVGEVGGTSDRFDKVLDGEGGTEGAFRVGGWERLGVDLALGRDGFNALLLGTSTFRIFRAFCGSHF